jgi:biopolymer transport protein ExbB/TolQ
MLDNWAATRDWESARTRVVQSTRDASPLLSLLRSGVVYWQELTAVGETRVEVMELMVKEAVERELKLIASMMRANLPILANIASVAPFIGLFGTVIGIILTFDHIQRTGNLGIELVASGIADALVATALGLFAAIPAVLAYNVFTSKINVLLLQMEETAMERIYFLVQRKDSQTSNAGR